MSAPDDLLAIAALYRCMASGDYAGAARLVTKRATLDGLASLIGPAWQTTAGRAYRESVAAWRAEHEATVRRQQERDVAALVALVAEVYRTGPDESAAPAEAAANLATLRRAIRGSEAA